MSEADFYRENGYLHVQGVFDGGEVEEMRAAIDQILADVEGTANDANHRWSAAEKETVLKGFHNVQYHAGSFTRAVAHPRLVDVLTQLIGPNVELHNTKMLVKPPENGAPFPMHQDYPYFPHERHTMLAASIHLDYTDEENGCLHVVPGSHSLGQSGGNYFLGNAGPVLKVGGAAVTGATYPGWSPIGVEVASVFM